MGDDSVPALIVMGVSGSGKSSLAQALARAMNSEFLEGDDLHSAASLAKMQRGEPLDDHDRAPWLAAIAQRLGQALATRRGVVVSCSALKVAYRNALRVDARVRFVFLNADRELLEQRLALRQGHFMPRALLASQFATLEPPGVSEADVLTLAARLPLEQMCRRTERWRRG